MLYIISIHGLEGLWRKTDMENGKWLVKRAGCNPISHVNTWHALEGHSTKMNFS